MQTLHSITDRFGNYFRLELEIFTEPSIKLNSTDITCTLTLFPRSWYDSLRLVPGGKRNEGGKHIRDATSRGLNSRRPNVGTKQIETITSEPLGS